MKRLSPAGEGSIEVMAPENHIEAHIMCFMHQQLLPRKGGHYLIQDNQYQLSTLLE
jgi:hypothetical protein